MRTRILICYSCLAWLLLTILFAGKAHAQNYNMGNSSVSTCGGNFYDSGGPGGNYGNSQNYTMTFCSNTPGTCIRVTFTSFDIENGYDFLYIYNGPNTASPLIGTYTGTNSPNMVTGTSGCLTFRFTSDIIFTNPGWTATISCVTCSAGGGCSSTCSGGPAPANDACANAQNLGALPVPVACPNGVGAWANFNTTNLCATAESPYTSLLGCQPAGNMASPASDVWYRFTITGPTLNVSISGGLITPNIGLYAGTVCNNLIPRGCAIGTGGILNTSFGGLAPGTYYLQVSGGSLNDQCDFTLSLQNNYDCAGCVIQSGLTVSPAPVNGTYQAGQTVTFCYTITDYNQTSINWLHAVTLSFGPGWNMSSLTTVPATSCDGQGYWYWNSGTVTSTATGLVTGPGFYYETPLGNPLNVLDGNPGNNFGDNNPLNLCDWTFCWTISTLPPGQCVQGASLNIVIDTYGDGESGSWTSFACSGDPVTNFFATLACCEPPVVNATNVTCPGLTNGSATGTGQGTGPWNYIWQTAGGATIQSANNVNGSNSINNLPAGNYQLTVIDNAGCAAVANFTITQPNPILPNQSVVNIICNGSNNGSISLNPTGGSGGYNYQWSPAMGNNATVNNLSAGNYTVTITDANGCTASTTINVSQPAAISFNSNVVNSTCAGNTGSITINANGGTGALQYSINGGGTFQAGNVFNNLSSGSYNVVVQDANGCQSTAIVNVSAATAPVINSAPSVNVVCNGGNSGSITINASGGTGALQYSINGGTTFQAGNVFNGLGAGNYSIVVQDANGCSVTTNVNINQPNPIIVNPNSTNSTCGNSNGSINITANGGTGALQYSINGGTTYQAGNIFNGLAAGNYNVVVQDANGCTAAANIAVGNTAGPVISSIASNNVNCNGGNNGSITINSNGGTGAIQYSINNGTTYSGSNVFNGLGAGNYNIIIQDANGCTAASSVNITEPAPIAVNGNSVNATCGSANGSITINANGGVGALQYSINGGSTYQAGNVFNGLSAGNYNVVVQDANGCTGTAMIAVNNAAAPVINSAPSVNVNCNGGTNGSITINGSGGTGALQYSINNGTTFSGSNVFNGLGAGTYNIVIQDANGCQASTSVNISEPTPIIVNPNAVTSTCGNSNGSVTINANGGTGALQYSINGGSSYQAGNIFNGLAAGNYNVVVQDANGCTSSATIAVGSEPSPVIASTPSSNVSCNGGNNGSIIINSNGGTGTILYSIDNGTTFVAGNTFNNLSAGTYNIIIQDGNGCTATASVNITEPPALNVNPNSITATCGNSNGSITINANGGTGLIQYSINGGTTYQAGNVFNGLAAGNYNIVVQDANGCTAASAIAVANAPGPSLTSVPFTNVNCFGGNTGSITINANGGTGILQYSIDGGTTYQAGNSFNNLTAGTYNIVVQDANGCTVTTTVNVTEPPQIVFNTNQQNTTCSSSNGSITINATGGTGILQYSINSGVNFQASNVFNGIAAGSYTVVVEDANGCTATSTISITDAPSPIINTAPVTNVSCNAGSNGSITINASGGTGALQYSINGGTSYQASNTFNGLTTGNYTVVVQDANGCTASLPVNISEPSAISANANTTTETCGSANGTITISANGGTGTLQYSINNGATYQSGNVFNGVTGGNYNIVVMDANGCTASIIANIAAEPSPVIASIPVVDILCNGGNNGSITVNSNGGTGAIQYSLNGGAYQTSNTFNGLTAGNYSITIQDANGCTATSNAIIAEPTALVLNPNALTATCSNSNGSITINANGGTGTIQYSINGGTTYQASNIFNGLATGNYSVMIQDANGCTATANINVPDAAGPAIASVPVLNVLCNGGNNGSITINSNGGTGAIQYSLNGGTYQTSNTFNGLTAGNYSVTIQDANGCTATSNAIITEPTALVLNPNAVSSTCSNSNGSITINANGGTGTIQYSINGGTTYQASNIFNGLASGNYAVMIQDANGCTASANINVPDQPSPTITSTPVVNVICNSGNNGSITINSNGGTGTIQYSLNGGAYQTSSTFNGLTAGNYSVTIQDANGCTATANATITEPSAIVFNTNTVTATCGASNGSITINANGGTGTLQFSIDGGATFQSGNVFNNLSAGNYNIIVTDASSCAAAGVASVNNALAPSITSAPVTNVSCNGGNNGTITVNANGGTGTLQYSIDNGATFQSGNVFNNLPAGTYNIVVEDINGCVATLAVNITEPSALILNPNAVTSTCSNSNGSITINANGGTGTIQYSINGGTTYQASNTFSGLASGNYSVMIQDAHGCTASANINVPDQPSPTISSTPVVNVICNSGNNGSITVNSNGGIGTIQYSLNGGAYQTSNIFNGLTAGNYSVTIQDANGCTATANATITEPSAIVFNTNTVTATCGASNGSITINANGGTGTLQFSINGGATFQSGNVFSGIPAGNYNIVVTDANNCTVAGIASVSNALSPAIASAPVTDVTCNSGTNGSITINAGGGTGALQYSINNGTTYQAGNVFNNLPAGTYNIAVIDANGCSTASVAIINEPSAINANATATVSTCGNSNGTITINGNGGTGALQFSINGGSSYQSSGNFSGLASGNFSIVIQDANGCTATLNAVVGSEPSPVISSVPVMNATCNGASNGSITINSNGGTGTIQFSIDGGVTYQSSSSFSNLPAGTYNIIIQDGNGCTATTTATITQPSAINVNTITTDASCGNSDGTISVLANGGTGALQYSINGGTTWQSNIQFNNLLPGNYSITVQDANGCTSSAPATVNNAAAPAIASSAFTDVSCNGGNDGTITINASGGTGTLQYSINNGITWQLGNVFSNLPSGNYSILVQDANGCQAAANISVSEPAALVLNLSSVSSTCSNSNGEINATANGGIGNIQFSINNGTTWQSLNTFSNLISGNYTILIQDGNGCTASSNITVADEPSPLISSVTTINLTCNNSNNGTITINHTGGTGAVQFSIDGGVTYQSFSSFTNLPAGNYSIIITDANGCTAATAANLTQPSAIVINTNMIQSTCGNSNGGITITANGGNGNYQYSINNGSTYQPGNMFNGLPAGNYAVVVMDGSGCTAALQTSVTDAASPQLNSTPFVNAACFGQNNGSITINASGGTGALQYSINGGLTFHPGNNFNALGAGTYSIVVTDANGCSAASQVIITQPPQINVSSSSLSSSCGNNDGSITISANGGTGVLQYSINGGITFQAGNTFSNLGAGNYGIVVQDGSGCTVQTVASVSNLNGPVISNTSTTDLTCYGSNDGALTITAGGGTGTLTYSINNGLTFQPVNTYSNLAGGTYNIVVMDGNNCVATLSITINEPSPIIFDALTTTETCGNSNGTITIIANGGTGTLVYSNNNGSNYQPGGLFNNLPSGNYTVVVQDANGCTAAALAIVNNEPSPVISSITPSNVSCNGGTNGGLTINSSGGTGTILYSIDGGITFYPSGTFNNLPAGNYNVIIEDGNGCTATSPAVVSEPAALIVNTSSVTATCNNSNGSIIVNANGGTGAIQYSLNGGAYQIGNTFNGLLSGNYSITVQDANGCTAVSNTIVSNAASPVIASVTPSNVSCNGGTNGTIVIVSNGGTGTIQYSIDGGITYQSSNTFNNLPSGNYSIIIQDGNGCTAASSASISQPAALSISGSSNPASCGNADGSVLISANGGTGTLQYSINGSQWQPGNFFNNLSAGNYTITVQDANGCTASSVTSVVNTAAPVIASVNNTTVSCNGGNDGSISISANGGTGMLLYSIDNGVTFQLANSFTNLPAGNYSIIVQDALGCQAASAITITEPSAVVLNTTSTISTCGNNNGTISIAANGGTGTLLFSIDGGATFLPNPLFSNLAPGNYSIIVSDANNCTASSSIAVANAPSPVINSVIENTITCFGLNNGAVIVNATGGSGTLLYSINGGAYQSSNTFSNLGTGNFSISVMDTNGCIVNAAALITQPAALVINSIPSNVDCFGGNTGSINLNVTGGTMPYSFLWSNNSTSQNISNISSGYYSVTVTDGNGCTSTYSVSISEPAALVSVPVSTNVLCHDGNTGAASVVISGGTQPYIYQWSNGNNTSALNNIIAGNYTVTVTDANNCSLVQSFSITEPVAISASAVSNAVNCFGGSNGSITVYPSGGVAPYSYQWSPQGGNNQTANGLTAGTYTCIITDANGCTYTYTDSVASPALLVVNTQPSSVSCYGGSNGSITSTVTGGTLPYTYLWSNGSITQNINGLTSGTYSVTVTDGNRCSAYQSAIITQPAQLVLTVAGSSTICISQPAVISANANGGTPPYSYQWSNGVNTSSQTVSPGSTTVYSVSITDANGCTAASQSVTITVNPPLSVVAAPVNPICEGQSTVISAVASGGNGGPYTYSWSNNALSSATTVSPITTTTYTVTVTDNCGTPFAMANVTVTVNPLPVVQFVLDPPEGCIPLTVSFINNTITSNGSSYSWNFGDSSSDTLHSPVHTYYEPGTYTVSLSVTTTFGCTSTLIMPNAVKAYPLPVADFLSNPEKASILNPRIQFKDLSIGASYWLWDFGDNYGTSYQQHPEYVYTAQGVYPVILIVENQYGCADTAYGKVIITGDYTLWVPNAFTPNQDGHNEHFTAYGIGIDNFEMAIFNRWGDIVFRTNNLTPGWNGLNMKDNTECKQDVYVYLIKVTDLNGEKHEVSGRVTLVR